MLPAVVLELHGSRIGRDRTSSVDTPVNQMRFIVVASLMHIAHARFHENVKALVDDCMTQRSSLITRNYTGDGHDS